MPAGVSRSGNTAEIGEQLNGRRALDHPLGAGLRMQLVSVNDALAGKPYRVPIRVGHVIAVSQKDVPDASELLETARQVRITPKRASPKT